MAIRVIITVTFSAMISLNGCALKIGRVDPSALPHVQQFKKEATDRGVFVDVTPIDVEIVPSFSDVSVSRDTVGICYTNGSADFGRISLLASFWEKASNSERENLMFHELGHCALGLDHLPCLKGSNQIMCPTMLPSAYYAVQRTSLIDELFNE